MSNNVNFNLSIQDTNVLKGLALCFLLCHHLFYSHREPDAVNYFSDVCIHGNWLLARFGNGFGKLCVALFVFLSGYGLTISTEKKGGIHDLIGFYRNRMVKLLVNYWFIWLVFVPYGVLVAGRSFPDVYGEHYVLKTLIDFCGMAYAFGYYGYNATWWFYSCIIVLYFLFPLLYRIREKWWLLVGFVFFYRIVGGHLPILSAGGSYVLAFALGIAMATYRIAPPIRSLWSKLFLFAIVVVTGLARMKGVGMVFVWDLVLCYSIAILYKSLQLKEWIVRSMAFLGKHSFNIFLFHTFFHLYYFKEFIYWSSNPILIFTTMLAICLTVSIVLEWAKGKL